MKIVILSLICCLFVGCANSDEDQISSYNLVKSIYLNTLPACYNGDSINIQKESRSIAQGSNLAVVYGFQKGDSVGIFPSEDFQIPFALPIPENTVQTSSAIMAQGWMTKKSVLYSVYLPWNFNNRTYNKISWDYRKIQIQKDNDNKDSLSNYWFLASDTVSSSNGNFLASLIHMGAILRVQITTPVAGTFVRMILATQDKSFATYGYFDLFDITAPKENANGANITSNPYMHQPFHALGYSNHVTLDLKNITLGVGDKLRGWIVIPETDVSNKVLSIYLWDSLGNCYTAQKTYPSANWSRNSVTGIGFSGLVLTTTPYTNLNPWENNENVCPTCTPVAF